MSTNIKIQRICEYCGNDFTARTTKTKYCSHTCNSRHYKQKAKGLKIEKSNTQSQIVKAKAITDVGAKEFLTVRDVSVLLGCSLRTAYRLINDGTLAGVNLAQRMTRINRSELNRLLEPQKPTTVPQHSDLPSIVDCYSIGEVQQKFDISQTGLQLLIKRNNIPKHKLGKFTFVPKALINELLT